MSDLAKYLIQDAKINQSICLDLGNCDLVFLPKELFELTWLEVLYLSEEGEYYDFEKEEIIYFKTKNNGKKNRLASLSFPISMLSPFKKLPSLKRLTKLRILVLKGKGDGEEFRDIFPLKHLNNLEQLDISNIWLRDLKPLQYLRKLKWLNISKTMVNDTTPLKNTDNLKLIWEDKLYCLIIASKIQKELL